MLYYKLTDNVIRKQAPDKKGIYFLGNIENGTFTVRYVGRSDDSIRRRLLFHEHKRRFQFFSYQVARTKREAFMLETENYYAYKDTIINRIHPDLPKGLIFEHPADTLGRILKKRMLNGDNHGRK